jgi:ubiquinone/menaquinone biosynthesis C-methylase UbiE
LAKYRAYYRPSDYDFAEDKRAYFARLSAAKLDEVRRHYQGGVVLDLCCGAGQYTLALAGGVQRIVGIDFSPEIVRAAEVEARQQKRTNVAFAVGNARRIPLAAGVVDLAYSFSALYTVPAVEEVVCEVARVLRPGATAVLDFGALYSLNTLVCRTRPETAEPCHLPLGRIYRIHEEAGLTIERDRSFQILPMWGNRPWWIRPLLHPVWKRLLSPRLGGRMLDEWISSLPPLRPFAFRHLIVSRKPR